MKCCMFAKIAICNAIPLILIFSGSVSFASFAVEDLIADAGELGKIQGVNSTTGGETTRPYIAFLGMQYAEPPIESRRFLPSVRRSGKLNSTGDIFYATSAGLSCIQPEILFPVPQAEDCLTINVYTPKPYKGNDTELLPVIFYIHGGAFTVGQGSSYGGNRLLNKDVVLVSFNYRLGVLGFFSLKTEDVPGNAGLYDIVNALKWTKEFVKYFNGDPNRITIAGQSAGSVAVTHLLTSPLTRGLFQGAIGASGTALAAWGTAEDPTIDSLGIAKLSNCSVPDAEFSSYDEAMIESVAECMRNVSSKTLVNSLLRFQIQERNQGRLGFVPVSPTLQLFNASSGFEKILAEHPREIFQSGRQANVPLMMGSTRHDGSYVLGIFYNRFLKDNGYVNQTDSDSEFMKKHAVPSILSALGIPDEYGVYDSIAKMYLGESRKSGDFFEMYPGLIDLFSVFFFKASSYQTSLYHSIVNNNTFWYSFDYSGAFSAFPFLFGSESVPFQGGITHGDDMMYLFDVFPIPLNEADQAVSTKMVDYWTNFATFGQPTPIANNASANGTWRSLTEGEANFLSIGKESVELQYYQDAWADIGWEVVPPTEPPSTTSSSSSPGLSSSSPVISSSTPVISSSSPVISSSSSATSEVVSTGSTSSTTPQTGGSGQIIAYKYLIVILSVNIAFMTYKN